MPLEVKNLSRLGKIPGYYFSGSQVEHSASAVQYCRLMQECLLQISSSVSGGWELLWKNDSDELNVFNTTFNRTFYSQGNRSLTSSLGSGYDGDCRLFVNIDWTTTTNVNNIGFNDVDWTNGVGTHAGTTNGINIANATSSFDWWCFGNEYEVRFITARPAGGSTQTWLSWGFGQTFPFHLPDDHRGVAYAAQGVVSGPANNVTFTVDRNIDDPTLPGGSLKPGYPVHVWGFIPVGGSSSAAPTTADLTRVVSVAGNQITLERIKQGYSSAAMIGWQPAGTTCHTDGPLFRIDGTNSVNLLGSGTTATLSNGHNEKDGNGGGGGFQPRAPSAQGVYSTSQQTAYVGVQGGPVGGSRLGRFVAHPNPGPTGNVTVVRDINNDLNYLYVGIGGDGGANSNWDNPCFQYTGSLDGKVVLTGNFNEQYITHRKTVNSVEPPAPATASFWNIVNGYGVYENWEPTRRLDQVVYGIDFEINNCVPCFEDIVQRQNLVFEEDYNNSLMKSNIYQFVVPTSSAIQAGGEPCIVPQAPFIYGIPSARAVLGRQKYRSPATAGTTANLPDFAQELTASC